MKLRQSPRGFTLIELLVVISIIAMLATFATPALQGALEKVARLKDLNNAKQIWYGLKLYADDNEGQFPNSAPMEGDSTSNVMLTNANDAYRNICPTYIPQENIFYIAGSAWSPKKPDEITKNGMNLQQGENQFAYVSGLSTGSFGQWPLIADGFSEGGEAAGKYATDKSVKGGVWKGQYAVVMRVDGTGAAEKCKSTDNCVYGQTGQPTPMNIFLKVTDQSNPWLSGTSVQVLNPK